jgi:DNA-binding XRE family transcriptional regulator
MSRHTPAAAVPRRYHVDDTLARAVASLATAECACSEHSPRTLHDARQLNCPCALVLASVLYELAQLFESTAADAERTEPERTLPSGFGQLLRRHRRRVGLTQEELAERAALSTRTISELECGAAHVPRRDSVLLLSEALGLSARERTELEASVTRRRGPPLAVEYAGF